MSKYNKTVKTPKTATVNLAGGRAYQQKDTTEFVCILLTSFLKDQFYRSADETANRIKQLVNSVDPLFAAKAAVYARKTFGMRSVSHLVAGEIARNVKGEPWTKDFLKAVVHRPDDVLEILAYYMGAYGKPIPNSMKKGLGAALSSLNEYSLAKYKKDGAEISMVDAVNLLHPVHTPALAKLIKGRLSPAETWETKLTQAGQNASSDEEKAELKTQEWTNLILENKLGYMALVRNLRNIIQAGVSKEALDAVCDQLVNEEAIKKSLMFPFRFVSAMDALEGTDVPRSITKALNKAVDLSLSNVPEFDGKTLIALDCSGSMSGNPAKIGSLFAATLLKATDADLLTFSDNAKYQHLNVDDSTLTVAKSIHFASGGTNFPSIFETANKKYDRVIILSDMQGWMGGGAPTSEFNSYCKKHKASPKIYSFDLQGYGTMMFPEANVYCFAGFSDKIFEVMKITEGQKSALADEINAVSF